MTISNTDVLIKYNGDGSQTMFALPGAANSFSANSEVKVVLVSLNGTEIPQVLNTDYTISGGDPGTQVIMDVAPTVGEYLVIYRDSAQTQLVDFIGTGPFPSETNERALDKLTRLVQEALYKLRKTVQFKKSNTTDLDIEFDEPMAAGQVVLVNDAGDGFTFKPVDEVGAVGPEGPPGDFSYSVTAFTAQTSVTVTHNFGNFPVVNVIDNLGAVIIPLTITHASVNSFTVTFSSATTGSIIASLGAPYITYTYIAYASDAIGTDFTTTFDPNLDYIAILLTTTELTPPVAGDFAGLWKNYKGSDAPSDHTLLSNIGTLTHDQLETSLNGKVAKADYTPAHSILVQQSGTGSPTALQIGNNTLVGRLSGGGSNIDDLSASQVKTLLDLAGTNTGDQTITLTGEVTGTGTGSFATTVTQALIDNRSPATPELIDTVLFADSSAGNALKKCSLTSIVALVDLSNYVLKNPDISAGGFPFIDFDEKGLVTGGRALELADITFQIPASQVGDGSVDDTEFAFLDGLTENVQLAFDNFWRAAGNTNLSGAMVLGNTAGTITITGKINNVDWLSLDTGTRELKDGLGNGSIDFDGRILSTSGGVDVLLWSQQCSEVAQELVQEIALIGSTFYFTTKTKLRVGTGIYELVTIALVFSLLMVKIERFTILLALCSLIFKMAF